MPPPLFLYREKDATTPVIVVRLLGEEECPSPVTVSPETPRCLSSNQKTRVMNQHVTACELLSACVEPIQLKLSKTANFSLTSFLWCFGTPKK